MGRPAAADLIRRLDRTVASDGSGLPAGSGTVATGRAIFANKCASCHGEEGTGGAAEPLVGGRGSLASATPLKTVGSYWPYATTLFDYIRRAMPLNAPRSLADPEVYGLVAYLLWRNGIVAADTRLDWKSLPRVRMPNRDGFVSVAPYAYDGNVERVGSKKLEGDRP
ncbi:cytochrome c [Sphingomonas sp. LR60]|uniref:c-type cytochrome n=1 Tax=Sphingomonas sp. LR60 TaxID=3050233 RepID=UPI002FE141C7